MIDNYCFTLYIILNGARDALELPMLPAAHNSCNFHVVELFGNLFRVNSLFIDLSVPLLQARTNAIRCNRLSQSWKGPLHQRWVK